MNKDNLIKIITKIYRITILFPKKEPLRYKIREVADDILAILIDLDTTTSADTILKEREQLEVRLSTIDAYLEIAKWQNWASYFDILEIQEEYAKISKSLNQESVQKTEEDNTPILEKKEVVEIELIEPKPLVVKKADLDERKQRILQILSEREKIQVWQVNEVFPNISKRTIRRDFVELLKRGLIERKGEKNNTYYQLKTT